MNHRRTCANLGELGFVRVLLLSDAPYWTRAMQTPEKFVRAKFAEWIKSKTKFARRPERAEKLPSYPFTQIGHQIRRFRPSWSPICSRNRLWFADFFNSLSHSAHLGE